ncbi:MAG: TIGR02594 family protein [Hyphomicrobium sp.]|uniref:TIGR02594 family protein n=1 Tax=Hyphomicrobium sp. TaxID=82 RepID=UPI003D0CD501
MDAAPWLAEAWREFDEAERPGAAHNPRILALYRDAGHAGVTADETAWCAAYVGASLERAGVASTRSLLARSYLSWGAPMTAPRMGAVAVFSRGSDPSQGHVGFWLGEVGDDVVLLGGNQSNAVRVARYPKSRLLGVRWPDAMRAEPGEPAPAEKPDIFERALAHVLEMEGGFTDDPHDPGGPTNLGVTLAVFAAWRNVTLTAVNRADLVRDLQAVDHATVAAIYRRRYWDMSHSAELPAPLAFLHFDAAVNHGVGTAIRFLQEAVGAAIDGEIGPETRVAIARAPIAKALDAYAELRRKRYRALPHFWRFGRGWLQRVETTLARAKALFDPSSIPEGETTMTTTQPADTKWWGHSLTIWGTFVTILSSVLPALAPVTGIDVTGDLVESAGEQVVDAVQAIGTLIGTLMTIYGRIRATGPLELTLFGPKR